MMNQRLKALQKIAEGKQKSIPANDKKISEIFASNVFGNDTMSQFLSEDAFLQIKSAIQTGKKINREIAEQVASAMKSWAMSKGATHYTHWFHPLTGVTAEKHDAFFRLKNGKGIEEFRGDALVQQEPDAAGFPTGSLRSTFEARGLTAWDPSSPAFIMEIGNGKTFCIPTIFVAYTGEALDYKSPLLKSQYYLEQSALAVCQYFDRSITSVTPMLGCEQEYFVVDDGLYSARPDLVLMKRTLFGRVSAKGQELGDHYFGAIPERIYTFMLDLEHEAHKIGIPLRTRHNETGPSQFEIVPDYEELNVAVDHNQLLMDLMGRIAKRHSLRVLLNEKPFAGINGSAKHNNWSLQTNTGRNLLAPAETPRKNILFLTFLVCVLNAVREHGDLLYASIISAGNERRLGAEGAPPAMMGVYIGEKLEVVFEEIEKRNEGWINNEDMKQELKLDIHNKIPDLLLNNTDKNRTAPVAFTGKKIEIRLVGASQNAAPSMIVLNTIVGEQLRDFANAVEVMVKNDKLKKDEATLRVLKQEITACKSIIISSKSGESWENELNSKHAMPKNLPDAVAAIITDKTKTMFAQANVFTAIELDARQNVILERYHSELLIEGRLMASMAVNHIVPVAVRYQNELIVNVKGMKELGMSKLHYTTASNLINTISEHITGLDKAVQTLLSSIENIEKETDTTKKVKVCHAQLKPLFANIRMHADELEFYVDNRLWTLPKYRELLFLR